MDHKQQTIVRDAVLGITMLLDADELSIAEKAGILNYVRSILHEHSPFKDHPVDNVLWVKADRVRANDYNPNKVAPPEMKLLTLSIRADGLTQPVVTMAEDEGYQVIDGFHRNRVIKEAKDVHESTHGYEPIVRIKQDRTGQADRMASTIRHNRARGKHGVMPMSDIVAALVQLGWNDEQIGKELGMDGDEVLRLKQNTGLPELFKDQPYGKAWE